MSRFQFFLGRETMFPSRSSVTVVNSCQDGYQPIRAESYTTEQSESVVSSSGHKAFPLEFVAHLVFWLSSR